MDFSKPPAWVKNPSGLRNVMHHHLYSPSDIAQYLSLPDCSAFSSGVRQFLFWKGEWATSMPENTIFLAFLGPEGLQPLDIINVVESLSTFIDISKIREFHQGAHTSFIGISFDSPSIVSTIVKKFSFYNNSIVAHITHTSSNLHPFRLLWLPPLFPQERVHHLLSTITSFHSLRRESIKITKSGTYSPTNILRGSLAPKLGTSIQDLPHLIALPPPYKGSVLLSVTGRDPICLKCREIGHLRRNCPMTKCSSCSKVHFSSAPCGTSSYSTITSKNITRLSQSDWLDQALNIDPAPIDLSPDATSAPAPATTILPDHISSSQPTTLSSSLTTSNHFNDKTSLNPNIHVALTSLPTTTTSQNSSLEKCDCTLLISPTSSLPATHLNATISTELNQLYDTEQLIESHSFSPPAPSISKSLHDDTSLSKSVVFSTQADIELPATHIAPRPAKSSKMLSSTANKLGSAIRSEIFTYSVHQPSISQVNPSSTTPFDATVSTPDVLAVDLFSLSSSDQESLSDYSMDTSCHQDTNEPHTTRKRKPSSSVELDLDELPSSVASADDSFLSKESVHLSSQQDFDHTPEHVTLSSVSPSIPPDNTILSSDDLNIASQLNLSQSDFIALKLVIPKQEFSSSVIKKLRLLITNSIPIKDAISHPQFFNLTPTAISNRFKTLQRHHPSVIHITDLFKNTGAFERMAGLVPPPQYTLSSPPADPFAYPPI